MAEGQAGAAKLGPAREEALIADFDARWSKLQPILDQKLGEPVRFLPQANDDSGEYVEAGAATDRPPRDLTGIVEIASVVDRYVGPGSNSRDNTDVVASQSTIDFDDALFDDAGRPPMDGDVLVLTSRPQMPSYKVITCDHDNAARWVCRVAFDRNTQ